MSDLDELRQKAAALGHIGIQVFERQTDGVGNGKFIASCDCGYETSRRASAAEATRAAIHHLTKSVRFNSTSHPDTHRGQARH